MSTMIRSARSTQLREQLLQRVRRDERAGIRRPEGAERQDLQLPVGARCRLALLALLAH